MMIDSFFNYLFGTSRFLTYILLFIGTIFITYYKALPKTRRTVGAFILQFSLLLVTQIIFYFTHNAQAQREPVLTFVYESYAHTHFPNFGGGLVGYYLLTLFIPLISIVGVIIVTILLIASSFILISKQSHRDVSKFLFEKTKNKSQDASTNFKEKRKQNKVKKEAKARVKAEKKAEQQAAQKEVKDVSDLPEISNTKAEQQSVIPIYGHSDNEEENLQSQQHSKYQRSKRKFNQKDGNSQTPRSSKQEQDSLDQLIDQTEQPTQDENANSISEA